MTKQDKKEISKVVKMLPKVQHKTEKEMVTVSGFTLLEHGVTYVEGKKVIGHKRYMREQNRLINHRAEAENAFKKHGFDGVYSYAQGIIDSCKKAFEKQA